MVVVVVARKLANEKLKNSDFAVAEWPQETASSPSKILTWVFLTTFLLASTSRLDCLPWREGRVAAEGAKDAEA